jgi:hypothetical protein
LVALFCASKRLVVKEPPCFSYGEFQIPDLQINLGAKKVIMNETIPEVFMEVTFDLNIEQKVRYNGITYLESTNKLSEHLLSTYKDVLVTHDEQWYEFEIIFN